MIWLLFSSHHISCSWDELAVAESDWKAKHKALVGLEQFVRNINRGLNWDEPVLWLSSRGSKQSPATKRLENRFRPEAAVSRKNRGPSSTHTPPTPPKQQHRLQLRARAEGGMYISHTHGPQTKTASCTKAALPQPFLCSVLWYWSWEFLPKISRNRYWALKKNVDCYFDMIEFVN